VAERNGWHVLEVRRGSGIFETEPASGYQRRHRS
jgi:hypothetical protein